MRGPYETSLLEFVQCVCEILEKGKSYTYNQAKKICGMSYRTIKDYATILRFDVNISIAKKCGRRIKPEKIRKDYSGFGIDSVVGGSEYEDPCQTELASEASEVNDKSMEMTLDKHSRRVHLLDGVQARNLHLGAPSTITKRMKGGQHVFQVKPFPNDLNNKLSVSFGEGMP